MAYRSMSGERFSSFNGSLELKAGGNRFGLFLQFLKSWCNGVTCLERGRQGRIRTCSDGGSGFNMRISPSQEVRIRVLGTHPPTSAEWHNGFRGKSFT